MYNRRPLKKCKVCMSKFNVVGLSWLCVWRQSHRLRHGQLWHRQRSVVNADWTTGKVDQSEIALPCGCATKPDGVDCFVAMATTARTGCGVLFAAGRLGGGGFYMAGRHNECVSNSDVLIFVDLHCRRFVVSCSV